MHALGYQSDERNYMAAVFALRDLQVPDQIRLMSNNPAKQQGLKDGGFEIVEEVKLSYTLSAKAHANLQGKVALMGHTVDFSQLSMPKDE